MMRLFLGFCVLVSRAKAQDTSHFSVYAAYDYVRFNASPRFSGLPPSVSYNANGVSGEFAFNPNSHLSLIGELSGYALARRGFNTTHQVSYLFGPRVNLRRSARITPFVQVLLGRVWAEDGITFGSVSAFGMTAGGGLDFKVSRRLAIRPMQVEYFLTKFPDGNNDRQNNFRFSTGVVFRFG